MTATDVSGATASDPITIVRSFCSAGPVGNNLTISRFDISSDGDEDEEWKPLDTIEVEVRVENIGDNDVDDVIVEIGLFDSTGSNVISDMDFTNTDEEEIELGDLNDNDEDTVTFEFTIPADFDIDSSDYKLAVKAYSDGHENQMCIDNDNDELDNQFYQAINLDQEDEEERFIVVDDITLPSEAVCGETVSGTFGVFNIGDDDQDQVRITMTNREFGVSEQFEIRNDFEVGDDETFDFNFIVPTSTRDGTYTIGFRTEYEFRSGSYREMSEETFVGTLRVIGCGNGETPNPTPTDSDVLITANVGEALPGQLFDVRVTFRNRGTESVNLDLDASGYQSWGELDSISDDSFSLDAGESRTVTFTFNADETASGAESFTVQARSANGVETLEVDVEFPEVESSNGGFSLSGNRTLLWIIGAINVVLIVLIIVVAVRLARK